MRIAVGNLWVMAILGCFGCGLVNAALLEVSHERGFYTNAFDVVLTSDEPGTTFRYTLNNKNKPSNSSTLYTGPISITGTSFLRIYASNPTNELHETHTYIFPEDVWSQPSMSSHIKDNAIYADRLVPALLSIPSISLVSSVINGENSVDAVLETSAEFLFPENPGMNVQEHCGTKTWGGSPTNPKKAYRLEFKPAYGPSKLHLPGLFDDGVQNRIPSVASFDHLLLRSGSQDGLNGEFGNENHGSFIRNRVIFDMEMELGNVAPHGRFVHVYLNGTYNGQYHLMERVNGSWMEEYFGNDKEQYDIRKSGEYIDGDATFYNQMTSRANSYSSENQYNNLQDYLNTKRMADYLVLGSYVGTFDFSANHNSLCATDRNPGNGGYQFMMWDKDLCMGNPGSFSQASADAIAFNYGPSPSALGASSEFTFERQDSVWCSMLENGGPATVARAKEIWNARADQVRLSLVAEAGRWGNRVFTENNNVNVANWNPDTHWETELNRMDAWFNSRTADVLAFHQGQGTYPSRQGMTFSHPDQVVLPKGTVITISNPNGNGTIYHALDGDDPRGFDGGFSGSQIQSGIIPLNGRAKMVWARSSHGAGQWSPGCAKTFFVEQDWDDLVITEIHYNANAAICGGAEDKDTEFIELSNRGSGPIDLSGCFFSEGVSFSFPFGTVLQPGAFLVLAEDEVGFQTRHGFAPFGEYGGSLDNGGETLAISDSDMSEVFSMKYNDSSSWPQEPDGQGPSLELLDVTLDPNQGWAWNASAANCGTPGSGPAPCPAPLEQVIINEVMYKPDFPGDFDGFKVGDWLELFNLGASPVNVTGWELGHGTNTFVLGAGSIPAGGFAVVATNGLSWAAYPQVSSVIPVDGLKLDNGGDSLLLWNASGCLVDALEYDDKAPWPVEPDENGSSLSLLNPLNDNTDPASWGESGNVLGTPGAPNGFDLCASAPPVVVINEINYDSDRNADSGDWIELHNPGGSSINLGNWLFADGNSVFPIPGGTQLPANGYVVLAEDPTLFASRFPGVPTVGPLGYSLSNGGEVLGLFSAQGCLVDEVKYDDDLPWELGADGMGPTLALIDPAMDNSEPWSWSLSSQVPGGEFGTPGAANAIPDPCEPTPPQIVINELNVDSSPFADVGDWVELHNPGSTFANISNWRIYDEQTRIDLPDATFLAPGDYIVLAEDIFTFQARFPDVRNVLNGNLFTLRSRGEHVMLMTDRGCLVDEVEYSDESPWPRNGIGYGPTLELGNPNFDNASPGAWNPSEGLGTPGAPNNASVCNPPIADIVINEISRGAGPGGDWIELYNNDPTPWDLSGSQIGIGTNYVLIPSNTTLAANDFLIFARDPAEFAAAHPGVPVAGELTMDIGFSGVFTLYDDGHCPMDRVSIAGAAWPSASVIGLALPGSDNTNPANWSDSSPLAGTPGAENRFQASPGAVLSGLQLWMKADAGVTTDANGVLSAWEDQSPAGRTPIVAGNPAIQSGDELNGHATVRFDGNGDFLRWSNFTSGFTGGDIFVVWQHEDVPGNFGTYQFGATSGYGINTRPGGSIRNAFGHQSFNQVTHADGLQFPQIHNTSISDAGDWVQRRDGVDEATATETVNFGTAQNELGRASGVFLNGTIAEAFLYDRALSPAERAAVETYLSVRHGITIPVASHQYYAHAGHPNDLVGLGKDITFSCLDQSLSRSVNDGALIELAADAPLFYGDYLVIGSDGAPNTPAALAAPAGIDERIQRTWRLARTQTPDPFTLTFDLSGLGVDLSDPDDLNLLLDTDGDGDFSDAELLLAYPAQITGDRVTFTGVNFADGALFTLGTVKGFIPVNLQAPNPVEAIEQNQVSFEVLPADLTYSFDGPVPIGAAISPGGTFTWTPGENDGGNSFDIPIIGTTTNNNAVFLGTTSITVRVAEDNFAPVVTSASDDLLAEGEPWSQTLVATDADVPAQTLTWTLGPGAPTGLTLAGNVLSWTPSEVQGPQAYSVDLGLSDGLANVTTTIVLTVTEVNIAPVLTAPSPQTIDETTPWSFAIEALDPDVPETLDFTISGAPGASIDANGVISWTPTEAQGPGLFTLTVTVTDAANASDTKSFDVEVREINGAPLFGSAPFNPGLAERVLWTYLADAEDPDQDSLTYTLDQGPAGLVVDTDTGWIRWVPTLDDAGDHPITIRVEDPAGLSDTLSFTLQVADRPVTTPAAACNETTDLFPTFSTWSWSATEPDNRWIEPWFNTSTWGSGPGLVGFGENDIATPVPSGNARIVLVHEFMVTDATAINALTLHLVRDDGAVIYLNGQEVGRDNLPAGAVGPATQASGSVFGGNESKYHEVILDPAFLAEGLNRIAIGVHQVTPSSNDMRFDARLEATYTVECPQLDPIVIDEAMYRASGELHFNTTPGLNYEIQACNDLVEGPWMTMDSIVASGPTSVYIPSRDGNHASFRIVCIQ